MSADVGWDKAAQAPASFVAIALPRPPGLWRRFARHWLAVAGLVVLSLLVLGALLADVVAVDPDAIDMAARYAGPFAPGHLLGADDLGRDTFARLLHAGRVSLTVGFSAMALTLLGGASVGACAGYLGGWADTALMRLTDMVLCFPTVFLILFVSAFVTPSVGNVALIIGLTCWMEVARLVHAQVQALRDADFVAAARMVGTPAWRIVLRQILPNTLAPIVVAATLNTANAILLESYISFLGRGMQPPQASWGNMLTNAQGDFQLDAWLAILPGLAITLAVASCNFIGDGLRDALDPRLRARV